MKKHLKTTLIILLGISAVFLVFQTWIYDSGLFSPEMQNPLVFAPERFDFAPSSAVPVKCTVMLGGVRSGAQYDEETRETYEAFVFLLAEALTTASVPETVLSGGVWQDIMRSDGVYFEFAGSFPLSLLAAWVSADISRLSAEGASSDAGIEAIGLVSGEEAQVYWICTDGYFRLSKTDAVFTEWPELPGLRPCSFAFEENFADGVPPRQLFIAEDSPRVSAVISAPPDATQGDTFYSSFLEKLELSGGATTFYDRGDERVYLDVESGRTCAFLSDGTILFSASAVPAAHMGRASAGSPNAAADVLRAWETLSMLEPAMGGGRFEVFRVTQTENSTIAEFLLMFGGIPVRWESAVAEIRNGVIEQVSLKLCQIEAGAEEIAPMPVRLAAAIIAQSGGARLGLRYVPLGQDRGEAHVKWVVQDELG
jgi:hypothetical protein